MHERSPERVVRRGSHQAGSHWIRDRVSRDGRRGFVISQHSLETPTLPENEFRALPKVETGVLLCALGEALEVGIVVFAGDE
jgi:hypothetical protein